ncbi:MAG: PucR family transcriptional regulator [Clostridiaceae bacterium]|jgi:carbohydrate diacid regulator|nr:helix-turn-helix domain-containing protein [Clostridia bacterium]MBP6162089.1 helix-turn-helix domain-containing protein [Clostridia bacterium]NMA35847.1 PucR family transcriptional regulator [Clostridiaceae bacterium]
MKDFKLKLRELTLSPDRVLGIADEKGVIIMASDEKLVGEQDAAIRAFLASGDTQSFAGDRTYRVIDRAGGARLICFVDGADELSAGILELFSLWIKAELKQFDDFEERDHKQKLSFLKNVLLENELPGDIPLKAREYRVKYNVRRLLVIMRTKPDEFKACHEALTARFGDREDDYILPMDEANLVLLLETPDEENSETREAFFNKLVADMKEEAMADVKLGVSMNFSSLKDTAKAYKEASLALIVGDIFGSKTPEVMMYCNLGLGRLIYQLPITLCELFLREVFEPGTYEALDPETLLTIEKFFENSLNGSETSRQLFVHRNTLVYRLDKVEKITGLDLRNFEDAVLFKLAEMVRDYLTYVEENKVTRYARMGMELGTEDYLPMV